MLSFIFAIFVVMALAFLFLLYRPGAVATPFDDARVSERCAEFEERDSEDKELRSLGYKGRIRQLLSGCF